VTLRVSEAVVEEIRRQGELAYPGECCGVLAGRVGETKEIQQLVAMPNRRTDDPHRYLIAPEDLRRITAELHRCGLEVMGYYHSHPDHPAAPSAFDVEHAWPWYSYVIVRIDRGRARDLASWVLADDRSRMNPESLEVFSEV
jgi:proteasome lid subunit RPN8/RPN11